MAKRHDVEVTGEQWEKIKPHLPQRKAILKEGRPSAGDRACWEGILWVAQRCALERLARAVFGAEHQLAASHQVGSRGRTRKDLARVPRHAR